MKQRGKNLSNLQEFSKSINYLQTHQIETMDDLQERVEELNGVVSVSKKGINYYRKCERELKQHLDQNGKVPTARWKREKEELQAACSVKKRG